jgi:hypothetical protein
MAPQGAKQLLVTQLPRRFTKPATLFESAGTVHSKQIITTSKCLHIGMFLLTSE